jgi:hypothetical protein
MVVVVQITAVTTYRTERLKQMASVLALRLPNDPQPDTDLGTVTVRNGKDIYAATDQYGEISHIGYRLFAPQLAEHYQNEPLFRFIERYLLELDLRIDGKAPDLRMDVDQVVFTRGTPALLRTLTPESDFSFDLEEIRNRFYRLTWTLGGTEGREVSLVIPANCQLIMGANAIELEQLAERNILRATPFDRQTVLNRWAESEGFRGESALILDGGAYMSRYIRGDLYISEQLGRDHPVCTLWQPMQSVSNLMLTGIGPGTYPLALTMNRYGGKRDLLDVTLSQYIAFCLSEGCKLYFGVKQKTDTAVTGALFAYNAKYAYTHLLDVTFPISLLGDKPADNERIHCTAYVYIPLKLLDDKLFTQDFSRITLKE